MIKHVLPLADQVLVMTVNPGFGGQSFIEETVEKLRNSLIYVENNWTYAIEVDGGIVPETAKSVKMQGRMSSLQDHISMEPKIQSDKSND